jgi:cysteine/histidine-rich domain-containing protein
MALEQCYNLGCQQKYDPKNNKSDSCTYHPGAPYFHDAYKGWSCCKKKSIDFTEFMNIRGCTKGFHSNEKPPEPEKKVEKVEVPEVVEVRPPIVKSMRRPDENAEMKVLNPVVAESLKKLTYSAAQTVDSNNLESEYVQVGDKCHRNGCQVTYVGPESNLSGCVHHPGVPIFHEGYKYWSCCKKKTTEFEVFQNQKGCTTGTHLWRKPVEDVNDSSGNKIVKCRDDWVQTGANVIVTIYGKKCDPSKSKVCLNPVKLQADIFFPEEGGYYRNCWILTGIVDVENTSVSMTPNKIEITMKKAEPQHWSSLEISPERLEAIRTLNANTVKSTGVEPVDLDDL